MGMFRSLCLVGLALLAGGRAAAFEEASIADRNLDAIMIQLETGDWNARIHAVHELDYLQSEGIPGLGRATDDGDWQVRMTAVHALGSRGVDGAPALKRLLKYEPCPVVRLMTLHSLGSLGPEGEEAKAMGWIFDASNKEVNACQDQPGPGLASWAKRRRPAKRAPSSPPLRTPQRVRANAAAPPATASSPDPIAEAPEDEVVTRDPEPPAAPPPAVVKTAARRETLPAPTKFERHIELDALLEASTAPVLRQGVVLGMIGRSTAAPETLPLAVGLIPREHAVEAPGLIMQDAGGKAAYDSLPALLRALRHGSARMRARAADDLGHMGTAASPAVPALLSALRDQAAAVRASAGLALGNIGAKDESVVPLLTKALRDRSEDVRYAAALALSRIDTPASRKAFNRHVGKEARLAIDRPKGRDKTGLR